MKKLGFLFFSLLVVASLYAHPISKKEAIAQAESFFRANGGFRNASQKKLSIAGIYTSQMLQKELRSSAVSLPMPKMNLIYLVRDAQGGFAIVAGDDAFNGVLAGGSSGAFTFDNMPDNLRWWMSYYAQQVLAVVNGQAEPRNDFGQFRDDSKAAISPLLDRDGRDPIHWDQGFPWNDQEPLIPDGRNGSIHGYTGCVATATAQIMKYYDYPRRAKARPFSYYDMYQREQRQVAINSEYDWANMPGTYRENSSTPEIVKAYSTLMKDVSLSLHMAYSTGGSGTFSQYVVEALRNIFGYQKTLRLIDRVSCSQKEWMQIIYNELREGRPVYYSGSSVGAGHAFVCDGYDGNGKYHFNWGWNGQGNGYYDLDILRPRLLGTGSGNGDFSYTQDIIVGIKPPKTIEEKEAQPAPPGVVLQSIKASPNDGALSVVADLRLVSEVNQTLDYGYRVYTSAKDSSDHKLSTTAISFFDNSPKTIYFQLTPNQIGQYNGTPLHARVIPIVRRVGETKWVPVLVTTYGQDPSIYLTLDEKGLSAKDNTWAASIEVEPNSVQFLGYAYSNFSIKLQMKNPGMFEYRWPISIIAVPSMKSGKETVKDMILNLPASTDPVTKTFRIEALDLAPGKYKFYISQLNIFAQDKSYNRPQIYLGEYTVERKNSYENPTVVCGFQNGDRRFTVYKNDDVTCRPFTLKNLSMKPATFVVQAKVVAYQKSWEPVAVVAWGEPKRITLGRVSSESFTPFFPKSGGNSLISELPETGYHYILSLDLVEGSAINNGLGRLFGDTSYEIFVTENRAMPVAQVNADHEMKIMHPEDGIYILDFNQMKNLSPSTVAHVYGISGNQIATLKLNSFNQMVLNLSEVPNGVYFVEVAGKVIKLNK